jgi:hypothetical protein
MSGAKSQAAAANDAGSSGFPDCPPGQPIPCPLQHWISVAVRDSDDEDVVGPPYRMSLTNGSTPAGGLLDSLQWDKIPAGMCTLDLTHFWDEFCADAAAVYQTTPAPVPPPDIPGPPQTSDTDVVAEIQRRLTRLGYGPGPIDGVEGPLTDGALRRWAADHGQTATSVTDDLLDRVQPDFDQDVVSLQNALNAAGYDCGAADGYAGPATMAALRRWRADHLVAANDPVDPDQIRAG